MRIGCLQFAPVVGDVNNNLNRADAVLNRADPDHLDLLVLPELAFSGYNYKSLKDIYPFLEPPGSGISSLWSRTTALKYDCTVIAGYPERVDPAIKWPTDPEYYNSAIVVNAEGETIANYRKSHLYYTDEAWALEGPDGFFRGRLPGLGRTAIGICMDLNPYKFEAPWDKFEFAHHVLSFGARLVVVSMAWITQEDPRSFSRMPGEPDMDTLMYWVSRLDPIIRADRDEEVIVVFANRSGTEAECTYAGTSAVIGIRKSEVRVYGILGRGDKELLVVDTEAPPYAKLVVQREEDNTAADAPDPNARGNPDSGAGMGRGDSNPRGSSGFGGSFDSSSKEPEDSGRHTTHRRAGSGSSWRRDDLFIHDSRKEPKWKPSDSPAFYTQTAPSPTTPYSLRSRAAPVRSSTERPWHPNQLQASVGLQSGQLQHNHRGDAGFEGLVQGSNMSPSYAQEPWHFEDSPRSSLGYWMPQHSPGVSANDRWILPEETENDSQPVSDAQKRENRLSIRSDVSVWNNNPGRPPSAGAYRSPPQESTSRTIDRVVSAPREIDLSALHRPEPPKSRQANRSRGPERSNSSTAVNTDLGAVCRQLEDMEFRVKSTEVPYSSLGNKGEKYGLYGRGSGVRQRSLQPTPIDCDSEVGDRVLSRTAIPIAVDDNSWSGPRNHEAIEVQASNKASAELPILRPASRDRIVAGNEPSRGRHSERPPTSRSANMYREPVRSNSSANVEDRAISRGRRRGSRPSSGHPSTQPHDRQLSGSRRENQPEPEPVDLSQFRLIVEYPSENCPVHGSRSRSGTGHRGTPNVRPPSHNQGLSRRRSSNTRRSTQNTPVNPSRQQRSGSQAKPATQSKIERPKAKISTRAATAAPAQAVPEPTNSVSTIVSVESSVASPKKGEPKTPVAMVLVFDGDEEEEQKQFKTPVKCMDRDITKQPVSRPRSAVW